MEKGTLVGKGRDAEVLYWGNNKVLKLFFKEIPKLRIESEFRVSKLVQKYFKSTPKVYEKISVNNREGIIFEFINGTPMLEEGLKHPLKIGSFIKAYAELHANMHHQTIPEIVSQKTYFEQRIKEELLLAKSHKKIIIRHLNDLPGGEKLCHGDFHPDNILISENSYFVIDWSNLTRGNPHADIARTLYLIKFSYDPASSERSILFNSLFRILRYYLSKKYFKNYKKLKKVSMKQVKQWDLIIYAVRLGEEIAEEQEFILKKIDKEIKKLQE